MASSNSTRRVLAALHAHGLDAEVREMPGSTRTAQDAAAAIGCEVAPLGLASDVSVWMDEDLLRHDVVWAAAGTPKSVFPVAPGALRDATGATVLRVVDAG